MQLFYCLFVLTIFVLWIELGCYAEDAQYFNWDELRTNDPKLHDKGKKAADELVAKGNTIVEIETKVTKSAIGKIKIFSKFFPEKHIITLYYDKRANKGKSFAQILKDQKNRIASAVASAHAGANADADAGHADAGAEAEGAEGEGEDAQAVEG